MGLVYKVIELSTVSDQEIESVLNEWTGQGWSFDSMQFAMRESSKRPAMAFISFTRPVENDGSGD
ncbi:MAG: DUF4177 domain-containing protein [Deltaproteobacteria bacterium]|nr:DUF4177 domain-containing protein [Deltaproteobacteria bacterium]MBW2417621.1 DUF4177 domain-containing protein [Deltaproteobacteria bacterium]